MKRKTKLRFEKKFETSYNIHSKEINKILWEDFIEKGKLDNYTLNEIREKLNSIKFHLEALHNVYRNDSEVNYYGYSDGRRGFETYGYESLEQVKDTLKYISDRYKCTYRLRWVLDLLDIEQLKEGK